MLFCAVMGIPSFESSGLFPMMETLYDNGKLACTVGKSKVKLVAVETFFSCFMLFMSHCYEKRKEK